MSAADLALDLTRAGSAGPGAHAGEAGRPSCGDAVRIELLVRDGRIAAARHRSFGCVHATAAAALACRLVEGRELLAAAAVGRTALEDEIGPPASARACVALAVDALHEAIAAAVWSAPAPLAARSDGRLVVAMSGGVDSAVALLTAVESGLEPIGVTLRLWIDPQAPSGDRACCSPDAVRDARDACHGLGVPHIGLDLREPFRAAIVDPFVGDHAAGRTPNPCVRCNGGFRFDALLRCADLVGAERVATGHYARVVRRDGRAFLARGADPAKDQSYMLAGVSERVLERVWFPLGDTDKGQTRERARRAGLRAAGRPESQDVCFVGGGDHREFLARHGGAGDPGAIVDEAGRELGRHGGVHRYTPGQRRGLGVSADAPLYVVALDAPGRRVVVGGRERLARREVTVAAADLRTAAGRVRAKLRYRAEPVWATVAEEADGRLRLTLDEPAYGVAPGQSAVLYDGDVVVGSGVIAAAEAGR
jgi:tRNA-specific 2-thiouridylase